MYTFSHVRTLSGACNEQVSALSAKNNCSTKSLAQYLYTRSSPQMALRAGTKFVIQVFVLQLPTRGGTKLFEMVCDRVRSSIICAVDDRNANCIEIWVIATHITGFLLSKHGARL